MGIEILKNTNFEYKLELNENFKNISELVIPFSQFIENNFCNEKSEYSNYSNEKELLKTDIKSILLEELL